MNDLARWQLRGAVRTLRTEHAEWDAAVCAWGDPRGVSTVTFRADGQVSEPESRNPDGSLARWARVFDDGGRLLEERFWTDYGPRERVIYSYDAQGRPAMIETVAPDGSRRKSEVWRYDSSGRMTKVAILPPDDAHRHIHYAIEGADSHAIEGADFAISAPGAASQTLTYDDRGRQEEAVFLDADGTVIRRVVFSRDHEGRPIAEVVLFEGDPPFPEWPRPDDSGAPEERARTAAGLKLAFEDHVLCSTAYAYDTKGRLVERTTRIGTLSEERTRYEYREGDDPVGEVGSSITRSMSVDEDGVPRAADEPPQSIQHYRYDYQYDSRGNWTERVVWFRLDSEPELRRSSIERRMLSYRGV